MAMFEVDKKDRWYLDRWGKFTSSENSKLLVPGKGGEMFGQGAMTYIKKKVLERMTKFWERPEDEWNKNFFHGKAYEGPAYDAYVSVTKNHSMRYFGSENPLFLDDPEFEGDNGGSPDGLAGEGIEIYAGLELKAPRNSAIHFDYLGFKDQFDLKDYNPEYYGQVQDLLRITKAKVWHWCSYDERFLEKKLRLKMIEIFPDKNMHNKQRIALKSAVLKRDELLRQVMEQAA